VWSGIAASRVTTFCARIAIRVHHHQWLGTDTTFAVAAPCSDALRYRVRLPGRDDNAMSSVEPNWTE